MADSGVRFIRVNGRVVPIKGKNANGPSKAQASKNYKKYGDGANQAARIDAKYTKRAERKGFVGGVVGAAGLIGAVTLKSKKAAALSGLAGLAGIIGGGMAQRGQWKKDQASREKDYVKSFGMTSSGKRPSKNKSGV